MSISINPPDDGSVGGATGGGGCCTSAGRTVLFDLDGTLVDSQPGVLNTLRRVLDSAGIVPSVPLGPNLIGPPLARMLERVVGDAAHGTVERLATAFRLEYDLHGHLQTMPYAGVDGVLAGLRERGFALFIVTNKRAVPTHLVLERLGWLEYFTAIAALDAARPPVANKSELVTALLACHAIEKSRAVLVGDSEEDALAAESNGICFLGAGWGYGLGNTDAARGRLVLQRPHDLIERLDL